MLRTHIIPFIRPMITKLRQQGDLNALTHLRLINKLLVTPSREDQVSLKNRYKFFSTKAVFMKFGQHGHQEKLSSE